VILKVLLANLNYAARAAKRDVHVSASGCSVIQLTAQVKSMASTVNTFCRWFFWPYDHSFNISVDI